MQLKGGWFLLQGLLFLLRGHRFPLQALGSPYGALFNCLTVGHSPALNCVGPRWASENIGLGQTQHTDFCCFGESSSLHETKNPGDFIVAMQ